jgi:hypothetical protein
MENLSQFINFWFEFDDMANPGFVVLNNKGEMETEKDGSPKHRIKREVLDELIALFFTPKHSIEEFFINNYNPKSRTLNFVKFKEQVENENYKSKIQSLSGRQLEIITRHFPEYDDAFRDAFEYFGQGALYDKDHDNERTQLESTGELRKYRVHMGDGRGIFGRWYSFIRAAILSDISNNDWLTIAKALAVAYMIHYKVIPRQSFEFIGGDSPEKIPDKQKPSWRDNNEIFLHGCRERVSNANLETLDSILGQAFFGASPD